MTELRRSYHIAARDYGHAGESSIDVQRVLRAAGYGREILRRVGICAYEAEMNVALHGGDGEMNVAADPGQVTIEVHDDGPGIEDVELALQEGYSTASEEARALGFGAGMGLSNIRRNADAFEIASEPHAGTQLKIRIVIGQGQNLGV